MRMHVSSLVALGGLPPHRPNGIGAKLCDRACGRVFAWGLACTLVAATLGGRSAEAASDWVRRAADDTFTFEHVAEVARAQLDVPYDDRALDMPCELVGLDYDSWRLIAFRPTETLWRDRNLPFQVETVHRGYLYNQRVQLYEVNNVRSYPLPFRSKSFEYRGWLHPYRFPRTLGHSGWKLLGHYGDDRKSGEEGASDRFVREIASFLGASYFRVLGSEHTYGSSLRGLAVDVALPTREEFPRFTRFWLQQPRDQETTFRCWALLESPRVVGAYQFDITPDVETTIDVRSSLWIRGEVKKLGIAPITSMWMWGSGSKPGGNDPRAEVHDADGMIVVGSDDDVVWRPLSRPRIPVVNHYAVPGLRGFGLLQRLRDADDYGDTEARYHSRPSIYIQPKATWPAGGVELLRLPAHHEGIDNIGAFYVMADPPKVGERLDLEYRIHICDDARDVILRQLDRPRARFTKTVVTQVEPTLWRLSAVAEVPDSMRAELASAQPLSLEIASGDAQVVKQAVDFTSPELSFELDLNVATDSPADVLVRIVGGGSVLSETWCYRCEP